MESTITDKILLVDDELFIAEEASEAKRIQPRIKVLYTTGYAENAVVNNGQLNLGVNLLNKPYRREELLEKVRAILDSGDD